VPFLLAAGDSLEPSSSTYTSKLGRTIFGCRCGLVWGKGVSQGEEAVLADSGRVGEITASIGRVRNLIFLSILQEWSGLVPDVLAIEVLLYRNSFSAAC